MALGICLFIDYTILKSCFCLQTGSVQRKIPKEKFPTAMTLAITAANKAGLNARARINETGQYSEDAKARKRELMAQKKATEGAPQI